MLYVDTQCVIVYLCVRGVSSMSVARCSGCFSIYSTVDRTLFQAQCCSCVRVASLECAPRSQLCILLYVCYGVSSTAYTLSHEAVTTFSLTLYIYYIEFDYELYMEQQRHFNCAQVIVCFIFYIELYLRR